MSSEGNISSQCNLRNKNNHSGPIHIENTYGGIPQNLLTNTIGLAILLLTFLILRKSAWKVLNHIVRKDDVDRWTNLFFSFTSNMVSTGGGGGDGAGGVSKSGDGHAVHGGSSRGGAHGQEDARYELAKEESVLLRYEGEQHQRLLSRLPSQENDTDQTDHPLEDEAGFDDISRIHEDPENPSPHSPSSPAGAGAEEESSTIGDRPRLARQFTLSEGTTFTQWLTSIFTMSDEDINSKCGNDALQYLRYQRHIIFYLVIVVVISICIILPFNFQGNLQGNVTSFEHTTLVNLEADSDYLWGHIVFSFVFFPLAILVMRRFSVDVGFQEVALEISKTLMIEQVPKTMCNKEDIGRHFSEAFPDLEVKDIRFAYDIRKLQSIHQDLCNIKLAKEYCQRLCDHGQDPIHVYPVQCSRCCSCCCCCCVNKVEGLEYYGEECLRLETEFRKEREKALATPVGIMFVTFKSVNVSKEVFDAFRKPLFDCNFQPPHSTLSLTLKPEDWKVSFAPTPDDIYFEHLAISRQFLLVKKILINTLLFFVTFFLTTPEYLVSQSDYLVSFIGKEFALPSWIVDFLPTLMLWSFTALLPLLVSWSDRFLGHWTRSGENHAIMKKTFWFLLFMVVLLPTFGFTTADATFKFLFNNSGNDTYRWECIFLPDSGAFFVNYIITASLVGAGLELLRFPEMLWYTIQVCWSKSEADTPAIRSAIKCEFRFGEQYARMNLIFCMVMMYSLSCPLITPFGLLYFITKHYVDRHNLLYAYNPSKINKRVHSTAISFVILSVVVLQFFMTVFTLLRGGSLKSMTMLSKVMIGIFLLSVNVFSAQLWSDTCKKFSPIEYKQSTYLRDNIEYDRDFLYVADILKDEEDRSEEKRMEKRHRRSLRSLRRQRDVGIDRRSTSSSLSSVAEASSGARYGST